MFARLDLAPSSSLTLANSSTHISASDAEYEWEDKGGVREGVVDSSACSLQPAESGKNTYIYYCIYTCMCMYIRKLCMYIYEYVYKYLYLCVYTSTQTHT